jgi:uncharacterized protein
MKKLLVILLVCPFFAAQIFAQDLFTLANSGTPEQVQAAIAEGADANGVAGGWTPQSEMTPLMCAAQNNHNAEVITVLLKAGARVNEKTQHGGMTALMYAAHFNPNPDVITALLNAGAKVNDEDDYIKTPLLHAAEYNQNADVTKALLNAGAKLDARNNANQTPLIRAAAKNNSEVVTALLNAGAKVNDKDSRGMTPVMWAAAYNQDPKVVVTLLNGGADSKLRSSDDKTAFDYAAGNDKLQGTDAYEALRKAAGK